MDIRMSELVSPSSRADVRSSRAVWNIALTIILVIFVAVLLNLIRHVFAYGQATDDTAPFQLEIVYHRCVWLLVICAVFVLVYFKKFPAVATGLITILVIEYISLQMYPKIMGHDFRPVPPISKDRFAPHPLLQAVLNPGIYGRVTHTAVGHRLTVNVHKAADADLIFVYGASTTYGSRLNDSETWPSALSGFLGPNYVVENHGVPGYSTVEHILQVSFDFRNVHAKCAIFYLGGTDLQSANLTELKPDYSNFHLIRQRNMGAAANVGFISRRSAFLSLLSELDRSDVIPLGQIRHEYDQRLSRVYKQNIHLISIITQSFAVKPIFVPEIWNYHLLTGNTSTTIVPFVIDSDIKEISSRMNADLEAAARDTGSLYLAEPLQVDWQKTDFFDFAHLTPTGSEKLARSMAPRIAAECK
jgi:hypothetical protein